MLYLSCCLLFFPSYIFAGNYAVRLCMLRCHDSLALAIPVDATHTHNKQTKLLFDSKATRRNLA